MSTSIEPDHSWLETWWPIFPIAIGVGYVLLVSLFHPHW